jgi:hypothetical protein
MGEMRASRVARAAALAADGDPGRAELFLETLDPKLSEEQKAQAVAVHEAVELAVLHQRRGQRMDPDAYEASLLKSADQGALGRRRGLLLKAYTAADLMRAKFPAREPLLYYGDVVGLRAGYIAQASAPTGVGKTWFLLSLAIAAAVGNVRVMGWISTRPIRVLYIDGEMPAEALRGRIRTVCGMLGVDVGMLSNLTLLASDWQDEFIPRLDTPEGQEAVEDYVTAADLVIIDNRSCLFDAEGESKTEAWAPAQEWLLSLRRRGKAVFLAHHAGRNGQPRGMSKPEDAMDVHLLLERPEGAQGGATFTTTWKKCRALERLPEPQTWSLTADGWSDGTNAPPRDKWDVLRDRVLEYLVGQQMTGGATKNRIKTNVRGGRSSDVLAVVAELDAEGRIRDVGDGRFVVVR